MKKHHDPPKKRPGPPLGSRNAAKENPFTTQLPPVRCHQALYNEARAEAEDQGMPLAAWLRRTIEQKLDFTPKKPGK